MLAINKSGCGFVRILAGADEQLAVRGQSAARVGARGIAGQRKSLAAAAGPVDLTPVAGTARLGHPIRPAEPFERGRTVPDVGKARFGYGWKIEPGQSLRRVAWQHLARRGHIQETPAPASHAGLWAM